MRKLSYALFLIASACASPEKKGVSVVDLDAAETRDVNLSSLIDNVRIIPLETNEKCLIAADRMVYFADDFILVGTFTIGGQASGRLLRFDPEGRFTGEIGKIGNGPGEHTGEPSNIRYDKDKNLIQVKWGGSSMMQTINSSGDLVQDIHLPISSRLIERFNDSIWFEYSSAFIGPKTPIDSTMIYFFTSDGKTVKKVPRKILKVDAGAYGGLEPLPSRYKFDDRWKFYTTETHTLSRIEDMSLVPEVVFESKDFVNLQTNKSYAALKGKIWLTSIVERENYLLLLRTKLFGTDIKERKSDIPLIFVDKNSMQAANARLKDNIFYIFHTTYFSESWSWHGRDGRLPFQDNLMYLIVNPDELIPMLENKSGEVTPEVQTELDKLKNLKETDNPVIFLFTLKDRIDEL